jgi:hypothetical protein
MNKLIALVALSLLTNIGLAQKVTIDSVYPEEVKIQGFTMEKGGTVEINGTGAVYGDDWKLLIYYGWILDSESREVVWHLFDFMKEEHARDIDGSFDFKTKIDLKAGNYELYFASMYDNNRWNKNHDEDSDWSFNDIEDALDWVFGGRNKTDYKRSYNDKLFITLGNSNLKLSSANQGLEASIAEAVVSLNRVGDDERESQGFTLTKETSIRVYANGEGSKGEMFDYAWISDVSTRERVFEMSFKNSKNGGGARKNLKIDRDIVLPAGSYMVNYSSDGSHSFDKWNALPPHDLQFWGVSVWPSNGKDKKNFIPFVKPKTMTPLVSLTRARDDEMLAKGISIKKEMDVRILCIGEEGNGDRMADYGWIIDANSREKIWIMKSHQTKHAGGANKNRYVEEVVTLDKGDYIVYYATDDSHSYEGWNSSQPFEPELWGITVWATKEGDMSNVTPFHPQEYKNKNELAVIAMVGDHALVKRTFSVDKDTKVRIVGLGEGSSGEMNDFGFVKNMDTGEIVWEMEYRDSEHGGGANKNREFNYSMTLKKGTYRVYYESDGSHSYRRWNADPPRNQELWGITVLKE